MSTDIHDASAELGPSAKLAEELRSICSDIWACYLAEDVLVTDGLTNPSPVGAPGARVARLPGCVAAVAVSGAWNGEVHIELTEGSALDAARRLLHHAEDTDLPRADLLDAVGELANMIGGNFKGLVPAPSQLGLPTVTSGETPQGDAALREVISADVRWSEHQARVTVCEREAVR